MGKRWETRLAAAAALLLGTLAGATPALADDGPDDPRSLAILQAGASAFTPPQTVAKQVTLVARGDEVRLVGPRGTRVWTASAMSDRDVPAAAMRAYRAAAATLARQDPGCRLSWTLVAAIGRVESDHGRYGGSVLGSDGVPRPAIIGIPLDGAGPVAAIHDTDGGRLDHDKVWDRAVGPMQFIPSTWASAARDGDGDGSANPEDIDDAALATASYLCAGGHSVLPGPGMDAAVFSYNPSDYYVALVTAFEAGYRTGAFVMPSPPAPDEATRPHKKKHHQHPKATSHTQTASPSAKPTKQTQKQTSSPSPSAGGSSGSSSPSPKPSPKPSPSPSPSPKPSPSPSPAPLTLVGLSGAWEACNGGWCVAGTPLDLGPAAQLAAAAAHDYDGDGTVETNADEFAGLAGTSVALQVGKGTAPAVVYVIGDGGYRNADGSFTH